MRVEKKREKKERDRDREKREERREKLAMRQLLFLFEFRGLIWAGEA